VPLNEPMPALVTLDGSSLPAPTDGLVRLTPPSGSFRAILSLVVSLLVRAVLAVFWCMT